MCPVCEGTRLQKTRPPDRRFIWLVIPCPVCQPLTDDLLRVLAYSEGVHP